MISIKAPVFLLLLQLLSPAQDLRITEVMPDSGNGDDWFEITNFTNESISLQGYTWADQSELDDPIPFPHVQIGPGESIVVLIDHSADDYRRRWGEDLETKLVDYSDQADLILPRFSSTGDQVRIFSPTGDLMDHFTVESYREGLSISRLFDGSIVPIYEIRDGQHSYRESVTTSRYVNGVRFHDLASPGVVGEPAQFPPSFTQRVFEFEWQAELDLDSSIFRIHTVDPNPGDVVTFSCDELPEWLSLVNDGDQSARLVGTPPAEAAGSFHLTLVATDTQGNSLPASRDTNLILHIIPPLSPLILNEYNAVSATEFLGGREEDDPVVAYDTRLGRVQGNGGFWAEFIVVGTENHQESLDIRGWNFRFKAGGRQIYFNLTENPALASLPIGTILTFTADPQIAPSRIHVADNALSDGYFWTNINLYDEALVEPSLSFSRLRVPFPRHQQFSAIVSTGRPNYRRVTGPTGEKSARRDLDKDGVYESPIRVGFNEVFKLEETPSASTHPITANYDDGTTSTFGQPNIWNDRQSKQDFSQYTPSNLPPVIVGNPNRNCISGIYQETLSVTDPQNDSISVDLLDSPDFLSVSLPTPNSIKLSLNREILKSDIGKHIITIAASNGRSEHHTGFFTYMLNVVDPKPSVIVNEINTVSKFGFLNGGDINSDSNGDPLATDLSLGRVSGNGGDWFELVVVGDGEASIVDIRDWKIEIGRAGNSGTFERNSYLHLNQHSDLSDVSAGTILLFYESTFSGESDPRFRETNSDSLYTDGWQTMHFPISLTFGRSRYLHPGRGKSRTRPIDLDANDTQIRILDAEERVVFGPVGEGILPGVKIGNDEILELEAHPSPQIGILSGRQNSDEPGYDDSDSESTFGLPNRFKNSDGLLITQDFSPFIQERSSYGQWAADHGLIADQQLQDQDRDSYDNLSEYVAGSSPVSKDSTPTLPTIDWQSSSATFDVRANDPSISYRSEYSHDLSTWITDGLVISEGPSPKGIAFRRRTLQFDLRAKIHFPYYLINGPPKELFFRNIPVIEDF